MATLVLSAAGAALGGGFGGTVLGLSGAVIGRAAGATLGRAIDQRLMGGSEPVEMGRIDRMRLPAASEGAAVPRLWGRMRLGGQVIWATRFAEHASRRQGGKSSRRKVTEYSYTVSLALGLCEGEILGLGRIWADGAEISPESLTLRVYAGTEDQLPDPKIEAVEGAGNAPAYRGLAYVVIEDLDLSPYGTRVPAFTFEVMRAAAGPGLHQAVQAVALIPGTGEYALATTPVHVNRGLGRNTAINTNAGSGKTDLDTSLDDLVQELPNVGSVSLIVSWFGNDLRCGDCQVRPRVEQVSTEGEGMVWRAGGIGRAAAGEVPKLSGRAIYGGTPADAAVVEAIAAIRARGREVMFYPFILMDQVAGNTLPDPWTGETGQPQMPWRGRITTSVAPGRPGTTDRSAAAAAEVAAFFGAAAPADFVTTGTEIGYSGPGDWGFRRFILHYAHLCAAAGGVDAFCIGSEMRGLTQIRDGADGFPAVAALRALAAEVKAILGPGCKVSYAADWTEYGSHQADGNLYFPLDPLWADSNVDFVGIDNYMPLSDWREGTSHADAHWGSPHALDYLRANIAGGEGFDWYYDSPEGEAAQIRRPIEDGTHGEPWVFRVKDLVSWWGLPHHPRTGDLRATLPTPWVPGSKPIRFTEYGCAAIDKGTNQPNRFLDALSSESGLPRASTGRRDDLAQMQYLRAMAAHWADPATNPEASLYAGRMVDAAHGHVWAWDSRPFPAFPARRDFWSDGVAYPRGHWLNGRATGQPLESVIADICTRSGVAALETRLCGGVVRGYTLAEVQSARQALQPLLLAHGCDVAEDAGTLRFALRRGGHDHEIDPATLAVEEVLDGLIERTRAALPETTGTVRIGHVDAEGVYEARTAEARIADDSLPSVSSTELAMALTGAEGRALAQRWLAEARVGRDGLRLALPPSADAVRTGDRIRLPDGTVWRIDRAEQAETRLIEAVRTEGGLYDPVDLEEEPMVLTPFVAPVPAYPVFLDLPLLTGSAVPHAPHLAVTADPWPGPVALWGEAGDGSFQLNREVDVPAVIGVTETDLAAAPPGLWDRGPALRLRLTGGALQSATELAVLNGANAMAIGDGTPANWEVFQFATAVLVAPDTWDLSLRLRGQLGTDGIMPPVWPAGSTVVLLDAAVGQIDLAANLRGLARNWRIGIAERGHDDPSVVARTLAFDGIGLRPYPVCHLQATGRAGSDVALRWIRRTRIEGDSWNQLEVPLGEETEAYALRILNGSAVVAEYAATTPAFAYPATQQALDGVTGGFSVQVAQLSARFGAGPWKALSVLA